jgi:hypothetical protein
VVSIPEGFELVGEGVPDGFEVVDRKETDLSELTNIDPARAIGSAVGRTVVGGLAGIAQTLNPFAEEGAGAKAVKDIQAGAFQPTTESGKETMKTIGDLVKAGVDIVNFPLSGLGGLVELVSGQGVEQAAETVKKVQSEGVSKQLGGRVFEETGSPLAATVAETLPAAIGEIAGLKGTGPALRAAGRGAEAVGETVKPIAGELIKSGGELVSDVAKFQTPKTREIARQLQSGEINTDIANLKLANEGITDPTARQKLLGADLPKVIKDKPVIRAVDQGFDIDFLETVKKVGTPADIKALQKMTNMAKRGRTDPIFRRDFRPSFVAGDVLLDKFNQIKAINRAAGKRIGNATKFLKGKRVPTAQIGDSFLEALDGLKIKMVDGKLNFEDALVSGAGRKKAISDIFGRMTKNKNPDALDVHELKLFLDDTISYGKEVRGLGGNAENVLRDLRRNIKDTLDNNFPDYAKANKAYSDTIGILDEIQSLAGKKTDLTSNSASGQLGILARRETSNAQSRGRVKEAFDNLDNVLYEHACFGGVKRIEDSGGLTKVDFRLLMEYANELDRVTGNAASTSFTGSLETAAKAVIGPKQFIADKVVETARKAKGISVENAHKSMDSFLKGLDKKVKPDN